MTLGDPEYRKLAHRFAPLCVKKEQGTLTPDEALEYDRIDRLMTRAEKAFKVGGDGSAKRDE